nr:hypothetical protein [Enterovirga rhinocerotis]
MATPAEKPSLDIESGAPHDIDVIPQRMPPDPPQTAEETPIRARDEASAPKPRRRRVAASRPPRRVAKAARSLRGVAAAIGILVGVPALFLFRADVVAAMPGTASVYAAMGLPVNLVGLKLAAIRSVLVEENGTPILEVSGEITNVDRAARSVPPLLISIESDSGEGLYAWSARAAEGELERGSTVPFRVRLTAPPPASRRVEVTFKDVRAHDATAGSLAELR